MHTRLPFTPVQGAKIIVITGIWEGSGACSPGTLIFQTAEIAVVARTLSWRIKTPYGFPADIHRTDVSIVTFNLFTRDTLALDAHTRFRAHASIIADPPMSIECAAKHFIAPIEGTIVLVITLNGLRGQAFTLNAGISNLTGVAIVTLQGIEGVSTSIRTGAGIICTWIPIVALQHLSTDTRSPGADGFQGTFVIIITVCPLLGVQDDATACGQVTGSPLAGAENE